MTRPIDVSTLDDAAKYHAGLFMWDAGTRDRRWVMGQFHDFTYKDEHEYLLTAIEGHLGGAAMDEFRSLAGEILTPRSEDVFHALLKEKLAIDPDGEHIPGAIGKVIVGGRAMGQHMVEVEPTWSIRRRRSLRLDKSHRETIFRPAKHTWNVYAGEVEERQADSGVADALPAGAHTFGGSTFAALNPRMSNEVAQLMANAGVDNLDEGSAGATIQGRSGAQPADPDTTVTGTNGFTLTCSTTAFTAATDAGPGALKTASAITDDSSADATITLGYCRMSSSNAADTPLDDHFDGEAGTSGADFNFNTLAIVSGAVVSMSALTITQPES